MDACEFSIRSCSDSLPRRVAAEAALLAERVESVEPAGQHLVHVGLVPGVEDDRVARALEDAVHRDRELDHAEIGTEVTSGSRHGGDQLFTNLRAETGQIFRAEPAQVLWAGDLLEQHRVSLVEPTRLGSCGKCPCTVVAEHDYRPCRDWSRARRCSNVPRATAISPRVPSGSRPTTAPAWSRSDGSSASTSSPASCARGAGCDGCSPSDAPLVGALLRDRLRLRGAGGGDPRAHYLHTVLERGAGVPIACSAIWIAVGVRAEIPVEGVNLPGHFVVRVDGHLFDTIASGEPLDEEDVKRLVTTSTGQEIERLEPAQVARASARDMLARMSRNLRRCYTSLECWDQALRAADRCVDLVPSPAERRDRGLLLWRMGKVVAALTDINAYLDEAPETCPDRTAMTEVAGGFAPSSTDGSPARRDARLSAPRPGVRAARSRR